MLDSQFKNLIEEITQRDSRYPKEAYDFLRDSLDVAQSLVHENDDERIKHVDASQLLEGVRVHAIERYGPMAGFILNEWGIFTSMDIGNLVFNLIEIGLFSKKESDSIEDFENGFSFFDAFIKPYTPSIKSKALKNQKKQHTA